MRASNSLQYLKNPASQTTQAARALKAPHKIVLTGTPIENRLLDLWSLLSCVMPGVLGSQASFTRRFQEKTDPTSRHRLARRVRPFLLRRTKEEVAPELPPRIEEDIRCRMEGLQDKLYRAELKLARQHLLKLKSDDQLAKERFNLLLFDPWWNPAVGNQAIDRAHRIGQNNTVFAYRLIIQGSIEDKIRQLQLYKSKLADDVLGDEGFAQTLTLDDFRYLLS